MWYNNIFTIDTKNTGKGNQRKLAKLKNNQVFQNEFFRNCIDAMNRYHIEGLPETCSQRVVLQSLIWGGMVCFYEKNGSIMALPCTLDGTGMNVNGDFGGAYVYGRNGYNEHVTTFLHGSDESAFLKKTIFNTGKEAKGVIVKENDFMYPFINQIIYFSERMADTLRKIEVAQKYAAIGHVFTASESEVASVEATLKAIFDENQFRVISSNPLEENDINAIAFPQTGASLQSLTAIYEWLENQYHKLCSFEGGANMDKKGENLLTAEIHMSDGYVDIQKSNMLSCIQRDLDDANKILGTNMTVEEGGERYDDICRDDEKRAESVPDEHTDRPEGNN